MYLLIIDIYTKDGHLFLQKTKDMNFKPMYCDLDNLDIDYKNLRKKVYDYISNEFNISKDMIKVDFKKKVYKMIKNRTMIFRIRVDDNFIHNLDISHNYSGMLIDDNLKNLVKILEKNDIDNRIIVSYNYLIKNKMI